MASLLPSLHTVVLYGRAGHSGCVGRLYLPLASYGLAWRVPLDAAGAETNRTVLVLLRLANNRPRWSKLHQPLGVLLPAAQWVLD
jgi:hypothetical protein